MGSRIEGGHDDVGTGPECARPRLLWIGEPGRSNGASRQRESQGASEGSEPAAACTHEGEQAVEILSEKQGGHGLKAFGSGYGIGKPSRQQACTVGFVAGRRFSKSGEMTTHAMICFFYTPNILHHARRLRDRNNCSATLYSLRANNIKPHLLKIRNT